MLIAAVNSIVKYELLAEPDRTLGERNVDSILYNIDGTHRRRCPRISMCIFR